MGFDNNSQFEFSRWWYDFLSIIDKKNNVRAHLSFHLGSDKNKKVLFSSYNNDSDNFNFGKYYDMFWEVWWNDDLIMKVGNFYLLRYFIVFSKYLIF